MNRELKKARRLMLCASLDKGDIESAKAIIRVMEKETKPKKVTVKQNDIEFVKLAYKQISLSLIAELLGLSLDDERFRKIFNASHVTKSKFYYCQDIDMVGTATQFADYWGVSKVAAEGRIYQGHKFRFIPVNFQFTTTSEIKRDVCPKCHKLRLKRSSQCPTCIYERKKGKNGLKCYRLEDEEE